MRTNVEDLMLMLVLVRERTLDQAAAKLKLDRSTVFRNLRRFEARVGHPLFTGSHAGLTPTPLALELAESAQRIEADLELMTRGVKEFAGEVAGSVVITLTDSAMEYLLMPLLPALQARYPALNLTCDTRKRPDETGWRKADLILRATSLPPEDMVGRVLRKNKLGVAASQQFVAQQGEQIADLNQVTWVRSLEDQRPQAWLEANYPQARTINFSSVQWAMRGIREGLGVGILPDFAFDPAEMVWLVPEIPKLHIDLWLFYHPHARGVPRIQAVADFLEEHLKAK